MDTNSIHYGTIALGADSPVRTLTFFNTGNRLVDVTYSVNGDMVCAALSQNIPSGNVRLSIGNVIDMNEPESNFGPRFNKLSVLEKTLDVDLRRHGLEDQGGADGVIERTTIYFKLRMPSTDINGSCSNTLTFTPRP